MPDSGTVRWGVLSTANIVKSSFLKAIPESGGGTVEVVGGRDLARARRFADETGIPRAVEGYQAIVDDPDIDAIYNPLPNSLHAEWTIAALRAGKAVLCEKPLTADLEETEAVLQVARETGTLLWEAFVFPFREQSRRFREWVASGRIGEVREVHASFHFDLQDHSNIRFAPELGGGGLLDVGCYCVRFGRMALDAETIGGVAVSTWSPEGVDIDLQGILNFPGERRLIVSCGMNRRGSTLARVIGTEGEIRLTNPYHPGGQDVMQVLSVDGTLQEEARSDGLQTFVPALQHINRAIRGEEAPQHLAIDESLGNAVAIDILQRSAKSGEFELPRSG